MKIRSFIFLSALFFMANIIYAQQSPLSADEILKEAYEVAVKENKNVFIIFHASWCGWCRKMDASMNDEACKKFFDDNFVVRHMVVEESGSKKALENPGAGEFKIKNGGKNQGLPYWLIFDKNGNLLSDSKIRPNGAGSETAAFNSGCPAAANEVAFFIDVLKTTTNLSTQQLSIIEKRFLQNEQ